MHVHLGRVHGAVAHNWAHFLGMTTMYLASTGAQKSSGGAAGPVPGLMRKLTEPPTNHNNPQTRSGTDRREPYSPARDPQDTYKDHLKTSYGADLCLPSEGSNNLMTFLTILVSKEEGRGLQILTRMLRRGEERTFQVQPARHQQRPQELQAGQGPQGSGVKQKDPCPA